tara:strand:+ start:1103 stop:1486 length:384 start_codon:yes stop_codon:yes gene_type:complete
MSTPKTYSINLTAEEWGYISNSIKTQFRVDSQDLFGENPMYLTDAEREGLDEEQMYSKWEDKMNKEAGWTSNLTDKIDKRKGKQNKEFNKMRKEMQEQNEQLKKQIDKQHEEIQQIKDLVALLNKKH